MIIWAPRIADAHFDLAAARSKCASAIRGAQIIIFRSWLTRADRSRQRPAARSTGRTRERISYMIVTMLRQIAVNVGGGLRLIGVGGIGSAADAIERLAAGAHHVQIATAAMINPAVGIDIRDALARRAGVAVG